MASYLLLNEINEYNISGIKTILSNQLFTSQQLAHIIVYIIPNMNADIFIKQQMKNIFIEYDADLIIFNNICNCKSCSRFY